MKIKTVEVVMKDRKKNKYINFKLPKKHSELKKSLLKNNIINENELEVKDLDSKLKSVEDIEIKNFNIKKPTNIYYLNSYLEFLKEDNLDLPTENIDITTVKLKELIAQILNSEDKNMTLKEINTLANNRNQRNADNNKTKIQEKQKPIFDINIMKQRHKERKKEERESE